MYLSDEHSQSPVTYQALFSVQNRENRALLSWSLHLTGIWCHAPKGCLPSEKWLLSFNTKKQNSEVEWLKTEKAWWGRIVCRQVGKTALNFVFYNPISVWKCCGGTRSHSSIHSCMHSFNKFLWAWYTLYREVLKIWSLASEPTSRQVKMWEIVAQSVIDAVVGSTRWRGSMLAGH